MPELKTTTDRRYALRVAIERAAENRVDDLWTWSDDKIDRYYENLRDGRLSLDVELTHPNNIQPSNGTTSYRSTRRAVNN